MKRSILDLRIQIFFETKMQFEQIETNIKFREKKSGFLDL